MGADVEYIFMNGALDGEKRVNPEVNAAYHRRGFAVDVKVSVPSSVLQRNLRVTARQMATSYTKTFEVSGDMVGSTLTQNANFVNVIAAMYLATGNDIACVPETMSAVQTYSYNVAEDALDVMVHFSSMNVAAVGGGTGLACQREGLLLALGKDWQKEGSVEEPDSGDAKAKRLACVIAGGAVCLDLSTLAAVLSNEFASAHGTLRKQQNAPSDHKQQLRAKL